MKIITLTLNPAFDLHCRADTLELYHENLATVTSRDAGGKGINISRALAQNGVESTALVVLGEENTADFRRALAADKLCVREIVVAGRIRENITVHTDGLPETRISFTDFEADATLLSRVEESLSVDSETVITLTGRLPHGVEIKDVKALLRRLQSAGARIVIDSRSFALADLVEARPWLIKPNEEEISTYLGRTLKSLEDALSAAQRLCDAGIENVMVSMGEKGACLACADGQFVATPPRIDAMSTIGAGDSAIAGFLAAIAKGMETPEALRLAVAYGTAACLGAGTRPPRAGDVAQIHARVDMRKIDKLA